MRIVTKLLLATSAALVATQAIAQDSAGTIGVSFDFTSPFRLAQRAAIEEAIKKAGAAIEFADANKDAQRQASQIDTMISNGVSAVIAVPYDIEAAVGLAQSAIASGIPFVSMDQAPSDMEAVTYHVGGDPCADGKAAGEYFGKASEGQPFKLLEIQGGLFNDNGLRRSSCLGEALKAYPNVTIVAQVPTEWSPEKALTGTENALQAHPDLKGIYTPWNDALQGVFSALKQRGLLVPKGDPKHIVQVSIDGTPLACQAVRDGFLDLDIATPIADMADLAVDAAAKASKATPLAEKTKFLPGIPYGKDDTQLMADKVWGCK
jgi:ribose transport system substrate-binding protein